MDHVHKANNSLDIRERVSYLSNASAAKEAGADGYESVKTPDVEAPQDGALRGGGAPVLLSRDCIGLLAQYACVGIVYGTLPATIYPFLQNYLNVTGSTYAAASQLVDLPWSFKVFYGIVSDTMPIRGFRRRPYMLIGWTICFIMCLIMACTPVGDPYFPNEDVREMAPADYTDAIRAQINYGAQDKGGKYVSLMMGAAFGYLMADVAADGVVVELAQREPEAVRGTTQSAIYGTRTVFVIFGQCLTGFAFNGEDYGGEFDFSLSFPALMAILAVFIVPVLPITWFFIKEEKHGRVAFVPYIKDLWQTIQTRAVYQIIFYNFFSGIFANFSYTSASLIQSYWAKVTPINNTISGILGNLVFLTGITVTAKWGLHWNWRYIIVITSFIVSVVDGTCTFITIWDVYRSQWFWLGLPIAVQVPAGINFIISTFVTVEIAKVGNEGAIYGLITTVSNLSSPFANSLTIVADNQFDMTNERMQNDDHDIRMDVSYAVILMYSMTIVSWFFVFFLPKQKAETQELVRTGGSSFVMGCITLFYFLFALVWSVMTNIMAIFPSTSCLVIAGGDGC